MDRKETNVTAPRDEFAGHTPEILGYYWPEGRSKGFHDFPNGFGGTSEKWVFVIDRAHWLTATAERDALRAEVQRLRELPEVPFEETLRMVPAVRILDAVGVLVERSRGILALDDERTGQDPRKLEKEDRRIFSAIVRAGVSR